MASKLRLVILGAPGSGKGTISSRLVKEFRLNHLATGDVIRANIEKKSELGLKVQDLVKKGQLVPDDLVSKLVVSELNKINSSASGWLLDGYPRTLLQAKSLDAKSALFVLDKVVNLNVPFKEIINRLKHRWIHPASGRVYNLEFNPPKTAGKDDITGDPLIQREDDREEVVLKRLKIYESQTKPILDFYEAKKLLVTFTGNTSDYLWPLIKAHVHTVKNSKGSSELSSVDNYSKSTVEDVTHTGQKYEPYDFRRARFEVVTSKLVNKNVAMELIAKEPVIVADARSVWSSGGGALGHPKIYINLDSNEVHTCGYSGRRFIQKKFYDESKHGKAIKYDDYVEEMRQAIEV